MSYNNANRTDNIFLLNISYLRKQHGLSKKEMARRLGIGLRSLNKVEQGSIPPRLTVEIFFAVWEQFHIKPSILLTELLEEK